MVRSSADPCLFVARSVKVDLGKKSFHWEILYFKSELHLKMKGQIFSPQHDPFEQEECHGYALHTSLTTSSCAVIA